MPVSARRKYLRSVLRKPALVVWALWLIAFPFYVGPSGYPQPSIVFALLLMPLTFGRWDGRLAKRPSRSIRLLFLFAFWTVIVSAAWTVVLWDFDIALMSPVYYIFNAIVFLMGLVLFRRYGDLFLRVTVHVVVAIVLFHVAASFVMAGAARNNLFFQNSNQLGYYALLCACLVAVAQRRVKFSLTLSAITVAGCGYLALISASRASAASIGILALLLLAANPRVILAGSVAVVLLVLFGPVAERMEALQARIEMDRTPHKNFFEERHYDRIWRFKEHVVFGAGEGVLQRFEDPSNYGEIHSSIGQVLFCYGLPGVFLLVAFVWSIVRGGSLRNTLMLVPPLAYTAAHNGMRFTMVWVLLMIMCNLKEASSDQGARSPGALAG